MKKEEIIKVLQQQDSTVLSFPDRGPWGSNKYRGNCSGYIQAFLIWKYRITKMAELFAGSGTGSDVARDMGVDYIGADLNPNPPRDNIIGGIDALNSDVPDEFRGADLVFMHPPYGAEIRIPYAGSMYTDPTGDLSRCDLGQMQWDQFIKVLNTIVMKYYAAMDKGAYMGILMGDVRRNGFHSMLTDVVKPGELQQIIIKKQNNYSSAGRTYMSRNFVPIEHEYIMVLKKIAPYIINFQLPQSHQIDIRDSESATWADVVYAVIKDKGRISLSEIYTSIEGHKKCQKNPHWKEKIRQTLQQYAIFVSTERGIWQAVA